jgi:adenylate cyclase
VIIEGDDIHGDGVNIAQRLQELADPGGIAVSGTAYDQFTGKVDIGYAYLGERAWIPSRRRPVYTSLELADHLG